MRAEVTYFNESSAEYRAEYDRETTRGYSHRVRREKVLTLTPGNTKVIDIASGPGVMVDGLRKKGCTVTCVDAAPEMIALTSKEHPDVTVVVGDAYALPFDSAQFDVALAMGLIEYLEQEDVFLAEACRILKEGGLFIITFPNYWSPWRVYNRIWLAVISLVRKLLGREKKNAVEHREYTVRGAERLLAQHGFVPEKTLYYNFKLVPYPLDIWFPRFTVAQSKLFESLDKTPLSFIGTGFIVRARR